MAREATWRNVGTSVDACKDYHAVLQEAGLDYRVVKKPGRIRVDGKEVRTGDFYTMRKGDPHHIYGRVSEKYRIVQNETAFSLVDYIGEDLSFLKAGETRIRHNPKNNTYSGGMVYVIAKLPETEVLGDRFSPNLIMSNDFSGQMSFRIAICMLRIICENQFTIAYRDALCAMYMRHTQFGVTKGMKEGPEVMKNYVNYRKAFNGLMETLAVTKLSPRQIELILASMFVVRPGDPLEKQEQIAKKKEKFLQLFETAYNAPDNYYFKGTGMGVLNAVVDVMTHMEPASKRENWEERRFVDVTFNDRTTSALIDTIMSVA